VFHAFPWFLPDGRHFLYLRRSDEAHRGIYLGSLDLAPDQQSTQRLAETQNGAVFVPSQDGRRVGYMLYLNGATLLAQPFDASALRLVGDARPVAEQVGAAGAGGYFSASAGLLAIRNGSDISQRRLMWIDRAGKVIGTTSDPDAWDNVNLSPEGKRIAASTSAGGRDVSVVDEERRSLIRLTFGQGTEASPVWSPDGHYIVYGQTVSRSVVTPRGGSLIRKTADGSGEPETLLTLQEATPYPQAWSPDGLFLFYVVRRPPGSSELYVLPLIGDRKPRPFLVGPEHPAGHPSFSPDGRWITYASEETGHTEVYVRRFDADGRRQDKWMISRGGGREPRWRRDGREIVYRTWDEQFMSVEVSPDESALHAEAPTPLFVASIPSGQESTPGSPWDFDKDGQRFLIISRSTLVSGEASGQHSDFGVIENWQSLLK
jgi:hypothetical protein